jgi:hypothetical protein
MFHRETMKVVKDDKRRLPPTTDLDRINSSWDVFLTQKGDRDRRRRHHKIPSAYPRRFRESVVKVSRDETHLQWLPRFSHCASHGHP